MENPSVGIERIPCRAAVVDDDTRDSGVWALLTLLVERGVPLAHMRLLRQHRPEEVEAASAPDVTAVCAAVRSSRPAGVCIRYDDASLLIIAENADAIAADVTTGDGPGLDMEVWIPVSMAPDGFQCRRAAASGDTAVNDRIGAPAAAPPAKTEVLPDAEFEYLPLWDVEANAVFRYLCHASWRTRDGVVSDEEAHPDLFRDAKRLLALDLEILSRAANTVQRTLDGYGIISVLIPVHFSTLTDPQRGAAYSQQRNRVILPIIESVAFEIVGLPGAWDDDDLDAALAALEPSADGTFLRVPLGTPDMDRIPAERVISVGTDVAHDRRDDDAILADLTRFAAAAKAHGLRAHVYGLRGINLSVGAARAGFDYLGSDAIAEALLDAPPDAPTMATEDLLKSILASRDRTSS